MLQKHPNLGLDLDVGLGLIIGLDLDVGLSLDFGLCLGLGLDLGLGLTLTSLGEIDEKNAKKCCCYTNIQILV